jgi:putative solute:sodium symporter small subunit
MQALSPTRLRQKVRRLTTICLLLWLFITLLPALIARRPDLRLGDWPLDFWVAAQGCVIVYLLIVVVYAWLVNRWERQAGELSFDVPKIQDEV